jgi:hypothetical protein
MNGYAINLGQWKKLSLDDQAKLQKAVDSLVSNIWAYSQELYDDAMRCNAGAEPCKRGKSYHLTAVPVTEADLKTVKNALSSKSLPVWFKQCNATNPECEADWKATVGVALGL